MRTSQTKHLQTDARAPRTINPTRATLTDAAIGAPYLEAGLYTWWRQYPAYQIAPNAAMIAAELDLLSATDHEFRSALRGDVVAAIRLAIGQLGARHPFAITTDLVMTALIRCALDGSAPGKIVMANIIKSCRFDHDRRAWLTGSWFSFEVPVGPEVLRRLSATAISKPRADTGGADRDHHRQKKR